MIIYVVITTMAAFASAVIAYIVWTRRHIPGATFLAVMMLAAAVWCTACVGEILADTLSSELLWARLAYIGVVTVTPCWILFSLAYTGRLSPRESRVVALFFIVPALTLLFVFMGPDPIMVWSSVAHSKAHGMTPLIVEHGTWFWVNAFYSYACLMAGSILLLATMLRQVRLMTYQGIVLVVAVALPWLANILGLLGAAPSEGLDLTPPAIVVSVALILLSITRLRALDAFPGIVPAARDAVMHGMRDGVLVVDTRGQVLEANRAAEQLLPGNERALVGRPLWEALDITGVPAAPRDHGDPLTALADLTTTETTVNDPSGRRRHLELAVSALGGASRAAGYVIVMREVTDRKVLEGELLYRATHDELTDLPNRALLREHLDHMLKLGRRSRTKLALLIIDLDHFKDVNDTFGHAAGDRLLRDVGERLRATVRESDLVARLGGDEFAVVLHDCGPAQATAVAAKLRATLLLPVDLLRQKVVVSGSIGIALSPLHGRDDSTLMRHADVALYQAKDSTQGVAVYQSQRDPNSGARLELLNDLRTAIHTDSLDLHFQPEIDLASGAVVRVEALARWPLADGSCLSATDFMPLAEQHGLMLPITSWALTKALRQRRTWSDVGWDVDVAVNLSALDLRDPGLRERIGRILRELNVGPHHLWLEITETAVMRDPERARNTLVGLCDTGVRLAIDDFGAGHSSLAYVRSLPASDLKIDRSFVRDVAEQPRDAAIVKAAVALAHDLDMTVTAEGVETGAALQRLGDLGCDCAQGHFVAMPMPPDAMLRWARQTDVRSARAAAAYPSPGRPARAPA